MNRSLTKQQLFDSPLAGIIAVTQICMLCFRPWNYQQLRRCTYQYRSKLVRGPEIDYYV